MFSRWAADDEFYFLLEQKKREKAYKIGIVYHNAQELPADLLTEQDYAEVRSVAVKMSAVSAAISLKHRLRIRQQFAGLHRMLEIHYDQVDIMNHALGYFSDGADEEDDDDDEDESDDDDDTGAAGSGESGGDS